MQGGLCNNSVGPQLTAFFQQFARVDEPLLDRRYSGSEFCHLFQTGYTVRGANFNSHSCPSDGLDEDLYFLVKTGIGGGCGRTIHKA